MTTFRHAAIVLLAAACAGGCLRMQEDDVSTAIPVVRVVHGWGLDTPYSSRLHEALTASFTTARIDLRSTNTNVTNVLMLERGEVDVAFTFADVAYMASVGQLPETAGSFEQIRAIAELPTRAFQVVVGRHSGIRSIADLRGRHVSLGPPGSGSVLTSKLVLGALGIPLTDLDAEQLEFSRGANQVIAGQLDAAFWNGGFPNDNIARATASGARLLEIAGPEVDRFRAEYPFLRRTVVPAGTYPNVDHPVHTVGVDGILVCRTDLDEALVHELTRAFFEIVARTDLDIRPLQHMNISRASSTSIPLHPGAARYYRERELLR